MHRASQRVWRSCVLSHGDLGVRGFSGFRVRVVSVTSDHDGRPITSPFQPSPTQPQPQAPAQQQRADETEDRGGGSSRDSQQQSEGGGKGQQGRTATQQLMGPLSWLVLGYATIHRARSEHGAVMELRMLADASTAAAESQKTSLPTDRRGRAEFHDKIMFISGDLTMGPMPYSLMKGREEIGGGGDQTLRPTLAETDQRSSDVNEIEEAEHDEGREEEGDGEDIPPPPLAFRRRTEEARLFRRHRPTEGQPSGSYIGWVVKDAYGEPQYFHGDLRVKGVRLHPDVAFMVLHGPGAGESLTTQTQKQQKKSRSGKEKEKEKGKEASTGSEEETVHAGGASSTVGVSQTESLWTPLACPRLVFSRWDGAASLSDSMPYDDQGELPRPPWGETKKLSWSPSEAASTSQNGGRKVNSFLMERNQADGFYYLSEVLEAVRKPPEASSNSSSSSKAQEKGPGEGEKEPGKPVGSKRVVSALREGSVRMQWEEQPIEGSASVVALYDSQSDALIPFKSEYHQHFWYAKKGLVPFTELWSEVAREERKITSQRLNADRLEGVIYCVVGGLLSSFSKEVPPDLSRFSSNLALTVRGLIIAAIYFTSSTAIGWVLSRLPVAVARATHLNKKEDDD